MASASLADNTLLYKRYMLQESLKDVGMAVTQGILSNSWPCILEDDASRPVSKQSAKATAKASSAAAAAAGVQQSLDTMAYISALDRLRRLTDGTAQIKRLFQEFTALTEKSVTVGGEAAVKARAAASREVFVRECGLEMGGTATELASVTSDDSTATKGGKGKPATPVVTNKPRSAADVDKQLQPIQALLRTIRGLKKLPQFEYEKVVRDARGSTSSAPQLMPLVVKRLETTMEEAMDIIRRSANSETPVNASVSKSISQWPVDFLRILTDILNMKPLESLTESGREQLRRITFDVEELQHDQQQAVTDGDMQKSEQLYFEQTTLLETMKVPFNELEAVIDHYKTERGTNVLDSLRLYQKNFRLLVATAVKREEKGKREIAGDSDKLVDKRSVVETCRKEQKAAMLLYLTEWERLFDQNVEQQTACFRAIDELEQRIQHLSAEQQLLIRDRIEKVNVERERALDSAAFYYFVDQRLKSSQDVGKSAESSVTVLKEVGASLEFGISRVEQFLKECVTDHSEEALLALRKEKLEQFRQLYLTLGDLSFKKSRHAEEIHKKIEYYTIQQEIAMDTLNPKAKEYSQAKKRWQTIEEEVEQQIHVLGEKSEKEAADFKPTELLLIKQGVSFKHPVEELRERNEVRNQKLLEYQQLMDSKVAEQKQKTAGGQKQGGSEAAAAITSNPMYEEDEVLMAERARATSISSRSVAPLSSVESSSKSKAAAKKKQSK